MNRNRKLTDEDKQDALTMHERGYSMRQIAIILDVAHSTISNHLRALGADTRREATAEATAARMRVIKARRLDFAERTLDRWEDMEHRVWNEYSHVVSGPEGAQVITLPEPPLREQTDGIRAMDTMINTVDRLLDGANEDTSISTARNVINTIFTGLKDAFNDTDDGLDDGDQDPDYDIREDPDEQPDAGV